MKTTIITLLLVLVSIGLSAQDQEVNGTLTTIGNVIIGKHVNGKWGEGTRLYLQGTDSSNDPVWLAKYTAEHEYTDLRVNVGDAMSHGDRFIVGTTKWDTRQWYDLFVVRMDGNIGIGVAQPTSKLDVNGTIRAKEVKIEATGWADFVFARNYKLPSLSEVEHHIKDKGALPDIPSEQEMRENGLNLNNMQIKLLQKIEELTLYVIDQDKKIESQNIKIKEQQNRIVLLEEKLVNLKNK